jgi:L-amino acid N-acyltransferase YncA
MMIEPRSFTAKDGRNVMLRSLRWEDLDDLLDFINSLVDEGADILRTERVARREEAEWLGRRLAQIENGELIGIVAEIDGRVIANSEVGKRGDPMSHIGDVGIGIRSGYRGVGIGAELMRALIDESRKAGLKILLLDHFATNKTARRLYEKMGFKDAGMIPKGIHKNGRYIDLARMALEL